MILEGPTVGKGAATWQHHGPGRSATAPVGHAWVGDRMAFQVRVVDSSGARVPDAPAEVRVAGSRLAGAVYRGPLVEVPLGTAGVLSDCGSAPQV